MTTLSPEKVDRRRTVQSKRIRMARAALDVSLLEFAELVSIEYGETVNHEKLRRIEKGRDVEYGILRAIGNVVREAISDETSTPIEWLGGGGEPVSVNPGYLKDRWMEFVIPGQETLAVAV